MQDHALEEGGSVMRQIPISRLRTNWCQDRTITHHRRTTWITRARAIMARPTITITLLMMTQAIKVRTMKVISAFHLRLKLNLGPQKPTTTTRSMRPVTRGGLSSSVSVAVFPAVFAG